MKKIKITTPENIEVEYNLADLASRTAAVILDMLIQYLIIIVLIIAIVLIVRFSPSIWEDYYGWIIGIAILLFLLINVGYFIVMELTMNGMTPGKKFMRLRTIRNNGQSITLKHSVIRNLFRVFIDMNGVGIIFMFFNKDHRRLGDLVASTIVVAEEKKIGPISLDSFNEIPENLSYYISKEEHELLRDYFQRKNSMKDSDSVRESIKLHFISKFKALGILEHWENFINEI